MSKVSEKIVPAFTGVSRYAGEKNDCVVRAIANSHPNITYMEAHAICRRAGRLDGDGMKYNQFPDVLRELGYRLVGTFGTTGTAEVVGKHHAGSFTKYPGITLGRMIKEFMQEGRYFVLVRGHATCVVDGELIDNGKISSAVSVCAVWKIED
jgi:hypothetical protein